MLCGTRVTRLLLLLPLLVPLDCINLSVESVEVEAVSSNTAHNIGVWGLWLRCAGSFQEGAASRRSIDKQIAMRVQVSRASWEFALEYESGIMSP